MNIAQKLINQKLNEISTSEKEIPKKLLKKANSSKSIESIRNYKFKNVFSFDKISQKTKKEINSNSKAEKILHSDKAESRSLSQKKRKYFRHAGFNSKTSNKEEKRKLKIENNIQNNKRKEKNKNSIDTLDFSKSSKEEISNNIIVDNSLKENETNESNAKIKKEDDRREYNCFKKENEKILNSINNILIQEIPDLNLLLDNIKMLLEHYPVINEFKQVKEPLFSKDDFDIFNNLTYNNIFLAINLSNIISVINLLWEVSNKYPKIFLKYINKLEFYFSYVTDEYTLTNDVVMLAPISENLYNYLSIYGGEMFKDETLSKKAFEYVHSQSKFNFDGRYYYEDMNSINLLNYIGESNYLLLPNIIYYIKENSAKKLRKLNIISISENFKFHDPSKDFKEYKGYNKIDLALKIKKDIFIDTNENFKLIPKNEYLNFQPANRGNSDEPKNISTPIKMKEDNYYLFEIKIRPDSIMNDIDNIRIKYKRYIDALKNTQIIQNFKFDERKFNLVFVCNNNYEDTTLANSNKEVKENVIYSNPQVGLSMLLKYDKKFKYLNDKVESIKNDNEQLKIINKKEKKEFNTKLNQLGNEINNLKDYINIIEYDRKLSEYIISRNSLNVISNPIKVLYLIQTQSIYRKDMIKRYEQLYNCFENVSRFFKPIKEKENDLCIKLIKYIGKDIKEENDKEDWRSIKREILNKYGSSVYYKGLVLFLFGEDHESQEDFSILSGNNSEIRKYVKNLIIFLSIFMDNSPSEDIEDKFQSVIVYISEKIIGMKPINELFDKAKNIIEKKKDDKENKKIIKSLMQDIISSFNSQNEKMITQ